MGSDHDLIVHSPLTTHQSPPSDLPSPISTHQSPPTNLHSRPAIVKTLGTVLVCALIATNLACQGGGEFGDGAALELALTIGTPGPTPTDRRPDGVPMHLWFRPEGRGLVGCRSDGSVVLLDLQGRSHASPLRTVEVCGYSTDKDLLLLRERDGEIVLMNLATDIRQTLTEGEYRHGAISDDGTTVALARDRTIEIWSTGARKVTRTLETRDEVRNGLALSANGIVVAAAEGSYDGAHHTLIETWNALAGTPLGRYQQTAPATNAAVWGLLLSKNGNRLAAATQADARAGLRVWKGASEILFQRDGFRSYWVRALALAPNGDLLVSGDERGNVVLWELESNRELAVARAGQVVQSVAISPDGQLIAAGLWDSRIAIWKR